MKVPDLAFQSLRQFAVPRDGMVIGERSVFCVYVMGGFMPMLFRLSAVLEIVHAWSPRIRRSTLPPTYMLWGHKCRLARTRRHLHALTVHLKSAAL